jgi:ribosome biogenesis ATPase
MNNANNLLNRQIMGAYRKHHISLNAPLPPSSEPVEAAKYESSHASIPEPTPKRKLPENPTRTPTTNSPTTTKRPKSTATNSKQSGNPPSSSLIKDTTPTVTLSDLGGIDQTVERLLELIGLPILHPEIFEFTGLKPIRGLLLCGPPGCGKTMLANAIANQLGVRLINVSSTSIVSGMSGESEKAIRDIFEQATVSLRI